MNASKEAKPVKGPLKLEYDEDEATHYIVMGTALVNRGRYSSHHMIKYDHGLFPEDDKGGQFSEATATATLIVEAYNAMFQISPDNPLAAARYIAEVVAAAKRAYTQEVARLQCEIIEREEENGFSGPRLDEFALTEARKRFAYLESALSLLDGGAR